MRARTLEVARRLALAYPVAKTALVYENPFQLLIATILSAQSTDARVNMVTPALFARYPKPEDLAAADPADVEKLVASTGFFRAKTRSLIGMATALVDRYGGEAPVAIEDLTTLPGVGRKTANVIRSVDFGAPGLPVDTHVLRLSRLLLLTTNKDPEKVEADLTAMLPAREWGALSLRMILHGRRVCIARRPQCEECVLADFCPSSRVPTVPAASRAGPAVGPNGQG